MRGEKSPARTEVGLVLRYDVLSVLVARLPLVAPAPGEGACPLPHPSSRRPPRLCLRESEWRSAQLHNAAQTPSGPTGWLTDWRCCAPWKRHSDWARPHPPAGSQSLLPTPIHDHPNWGAGAGNTGFGLGMTCSEPCFGMRNAVPLTFHLSRFHVLWSLEQPDRHFHRSSSLSCQTAAPWLLSSGHWYYRSRAPLSISVWLTYLLQGKLEKNEATSNC